MSTITVTGCAVAPAIKPEKEKPKMIEATTPLNGFDVTVKAVRELKMDLKGIPVGLLRMFYNAGVAFAKTDPATEAELNLWRNSTIWPVTDK